MTPSAQTSAFNEIESLKWYSINWHSLYIILKACDASPEWLGDAYLHLFAS